MGQLLFSARFTLFTAGIRHFCFSSCESSRREEGVTSYLLFRFIPKFVCLLSKPIFTQASCHYSRPSIAGATLGRMFGIHFTLRFHRYAVHLSHLKNQKNIPLKCYFVANNFYGECNLKNYLAKQGLIFPNVSLDYRCTYHRRSNRQLL